MHSQIKIAVRTLSISAVALLTGACAGSSGTDEPLAMQRAAVTPPQPIDQWEPVQAGIAVPTALDLADRSGSGWIGYSDGSVYFTSRASDAVPSWSRMDKATGPYGSQIDMHFAKPITAIAVADTFDDYVAYVGLNNEHFYSDLYRVVYNQSGPQWARLPIPLYDFEGVSVNSVDQARLYVASSSAIGGVLYSSDYGQTWQNTTSGDPLTPPNGCAISATTASNLASYDRILVGCTNGDVWAVTGARTGTPAWLRLDESHFSSLPNASITRLQIDRRDTSGMTFLAVVYGAGDNAIWITRNGGQWWLPTATPIVSGGNPHPSTLSASLSQAPSATSIYGQLLYFGGVRSDDNGQTWFQTPRWSGKNLAVEYKHYDRDPNSNQLMPLFRVRNLGSVPAPVGGLTFRYLFTPEGTATQTYWCDYSPYCQWDSTGCTTVHGTVSGGLLSVNIASTVTATVDAAQPSGEVQGRVAKSDWTPYDQSNDFSFIQSAYDWQLNRRVQLCDGQGNWLWGTFVP